MSANFPCCDLLKLISKEDLTLDRLLKWPFEAKNKDFLGLKGKTRRRTPEENKKLRAH